jgi:hypothetical protein
MDTATLQTNLADAQKTLALLMTGRRLVSGSYNGKSVTYSQLDIGSLVMWIYMLQRQLGLVGPRRALIPYYR